MPRRKATSAAPAQAGHSTDAISHYSAAIKLKPDFAEAHYNLGLALTNTGNLEEAAQQFREAARLAAQRCSIASERGNGLRAIEPAGRIAGRGTNGIGVSPLEWATESWRSRSTPGSRNIVERDTQR